MNMSRVAFASAIVAALFFGGVVGATVLSKSVIAPASAATASPSPGFHSNEDPGHEKGESAAQEAAENNGTFRPGGHNGQSNESAAHEAGESAAHEAGEKS